MNREKQDSANDLPVQFRRILDYCLGIRRESSSPSGAMDGRDAIEIDARATELVLHYSAAATIFQFEVRSSLLLLYM
jgi:hypothetical protein